MYEDELEGADRDEFEARYPYEVQLHSCTPRCFAREADAFEHVARLGAMIPDAVLTIRYRQWTDVEETSIRAAIDNVRKRLPGNVTIRAVPKR